MDLVAAAIRRIEALGGLSVVATEVDDSLWLKVEKSCCKPCRIWLNVCGKNA